MIFGGWLSCLPPHARALMGSQRPLLLRTRQLLRTKESQMIAVQKPMKGFT